MVGLGVVLDWHASIVVASTRVRDRLRGVGSVSLGTRIRTSAMASMASVCGGHWCGESTSGGGIAGRLDRGRLVTCPDEM